MLGKAFSPGGQCSMGGGHTEVMGMLCLEDYKTWLDKSRADLAYPWQPSGFEEEGGKDTSGGSFQSSFV